MLNPKKQGDYLESENFKLTEATVNLKNCDREPIHIPGSIQPHGYLIAFSEDGIVQYVSQNLEEILGRTPTDLIGEPLTAIIGQENALRLRESYPALLQKKYFSQTLRNKEGEAVCFDIILHRNQQFFILEMEPVTQKYAEVVDLEYFNESLWHLQNSITPTELAEIAAKKLKEITGFGRVMVYRFLQDGSGEVIAEEKEVNLEPYLGLRYPASDIPQQARALYLRNPIRIIPDVHYKPVPILSASRDSDQHPLDLSLAGLRSVSPIHIQYLKNMEVEASMSISIVRENKLWGLFAFHHTRPFHLSYHRRQLCLLLARSFS